MTISPGQYSTSDSPVYLKGVSAMHDLAVHEVSLKENRSKRNRNRSKRRQIFCPMHGCQMDSVSPKHSIFGDRVEHLQQAGFDRGLANILMAAHTTISIPGEWLEKFWCMECDKAQWYRVKRYHRPDGGGAAQYFVEIAAQELWQRVAGVHDPMGNPSVGEFTRKQAKATGMVRDFKFIM
jgi:hypothetical protein